MESPAAWRAGAGRSSMETKEERAVEEEGATEVQKPTSADWAGCTRRRKVRLFRGHFPF